MPGRVSCALVALAALAGCSLAGSDGNACINSCHCHSFGLMAASSPLLGAALPPPLDQGVPAAPSLHTQGERFPSRCVESEVVAATWGATLEDCNSKDITDKVRKAWNRNVHKFAAKDNHTYFNITTSTWTPEGKKKTTWRAGGEQILVFDTCSSDSDVSSLRPSPFRSHVTSSFPWWAVSCLVQAAAFKTVMCLP